MEENVTIACPREFPLGTRVEIEGVGLRTCTDRGGAIKGKRIDVYMADIDDAITLGRRLLEVRFLD
ncbi:Cell wall-binding protein YocH precursor [compost metagenome]